MRGEGGCHSLPLEVAHDKGGWDYAIGWDCANEIRQSQIGNSHLVPTFSFFYVN